MKLSKWAKLKGIHYNTAVRWFHLGLIPNAEQLKTGTILIHENRDETDLVKDLISIIKTLDKNKINKLKEALNDQNL